MPQIPKILINAANLHLGGAVQVAASFILELSKTSNIFPACELIVYASTVVDKNLTASGFDRKSFANYYILDIHGTESLQKKIADKFAGFDLIFTIFGPLYLTKSVPNQITGFAQAWIIYPTNDIGIKLGLKNKILLKLKFFLQWWFFKRSDRLVVELPHVRDRLSKTKGFPFEKIDVVNNCISPIYSNTSLWAAFETNKLLRKTAIKIGYVSRNYLHKNIESLLAIVKELDKISNIDYQFCVTLTKDEWETFQPEFKRRITNIGPLSIAQCPTFYKSIDGVIFPSLLECFSATPLEAMAMRRPLFASDRGFVRDCCGDNANYFDPLNAKQAAEVIDEWFCNTSIELRTSFIEKAHQHVISLPTSKDRATAYINIINQQLN